MPHIKENQPFSDVDAKEDQSRKLTQTDHLNKLLLNAFLQHLNKSEDNNDPGDQKPLTNPESTTLNNK